MRRFGECWLARWRDFNGGVVVGVLMGLLSAVLVFIALLLLLLTAGAEGRTVLEKALVVVLVSSRGKPFGVAGV